MATPKKKPAAKKPTTKKVMDVARPGKTQPNASARPVIVGHRPTVKDPMVNEGKNMPNDDDAPTEEHKIEVKRTAPKVIMPLEGAEKAAEAPAEETASTDEQTPDTAAEAEGAPSETDADTPSGDEALPDDITEPDTPEAEAPNVAEEQQPDTKDKPSKTKDDSGKSKDKDKSKGSSDNSGKKKDDKNTAEMEARLAEVERLVDGKEYFVHTSHTTKKQRRTGLLLLLIVLLLALGTYLAIDGQLIKNDIKLPYEFFKETQQQEPVVIVPAGTTDNKNKQTQKEEPVIPTGWTAKEAKSMLLSFALPQGWTYEDHTENACIKGTSLEINAPADAIATAATAVSVTDFKRYTVSINTTYENRPKECAPLESGIDADSPSAWHSSDKVTSGLFANTWLTWDSPYVDKTKASISVQTAKSYDTDNGPLGDDPILEINGKKWIVRIQPQGADTAQQMSEPVGFSLDEFKKTPLYKDTVKLLGTFEYAKDAL